MDTNEVLALSARKKSEKHPHTEESKVAGALVTSDKSSFPGCGANRAVCGVAGDGVKTNRVVKARRWVKKDSPNTSAKLGVVTDNPFSVLEEKYPVEPNEVIDPYLLGVNSGKLEKISSKGTEEVPPLSANCVAEAEVKQKPKHVRDRLKVKHNKGNKASKKRDLVAKAIVNDEQKYELPVEPVMVKDLNMDDYHRHILANNSFDAADSSPINTLLGRITYRGFVDHDTGCICFSCQENSHTEWMVNPWALTQNYATRTFSYEIVGGKVWLEGVFKVTDIDGNNLGSKTFVGCYKLFQGNYFVLENTTCKTLYKVDTNVEENEARPAISDMYDGSVTERIHNSALAVAKNVDFRQGFDVKDLVYRVKAHYIKFYQSYSGLDDDAYQIVMSDWFADLHAEYVRKTYNAYKSRIIGAVSRDLATIGKDFVWEYRKRWYWKVAKTAVRPLVGAILASSPWLAYVPLVIQSLVGVHQIYEWGKQLYDLYEFDQQEYAQQEFLRWYPDRVKPAIKASKIYIKTSLVDLNKEPLPMDSESKIETNYDHIDNCDYIAKEVDVAGSVIKGAPLVIPDWTMAANAEHAMRIRRLFVREVDSDAMDDYCRHAINIIDNMDEFDLSNADYESYYKSHYSAKMAAELITWRE
jgi:hypothetical protein